MFLLKRFTCRKVCSTCEPQGRDRLPSDTSLVNCRFRSMSMGKYFYMCQAYWKLSVDLGQSRKTCESELWIVCQENLLSLCTVIKNHHHWQNSPSWAVAFLRSFCRILSRFRCSGFCDSRQLCVQPSTWRMRSLYLCPPGTGDPVMPPGIRLTFRRLLRLAGVPWRHSNAPPHGKWVKIPHINSQNISFSC
jgi:hypothetical protein